MAHRSLGSSKVIHTAEASKLSEEIGRQAAVTVNKARNGRCTAATMAYADMQRAIGAFEAHQKSGGAAWKPQTAIVDAAHEYNKHCVRDDHTGLSGARRRKR